MDITPNALAKFLATTKKRGAMTLSILGEKSKFIDAVNTDIGQQLLGDLVEMHETLLKKISNNGASDYDRSEYKIVKEMLVRWSERIENYNRRLEEVKKAMGV